VVVAEPMTARSQRRRLGQANSRRSQRKSRFARVGEDIRTPWSEAEQMASGDSQRLSGRLGRHLRGFNNRLSPVVSQDPRSWKTTFRCHQERESDHLPAETRVHWFASTSGGWTGRHRQPGRMFGSRVEVDVQWCTEVSTGCRSDSPVRVCRSKSNDRFQR